MWTFIIRIRNHDPQMMHIHGFTADQRKDAYAKAKFYIEFAGMQANGIAFEEYTDTGSQPGAFNAPTPQPISHCYS